MFGFYEKRKLKKMLFSRTFLVLMCVPIVFMSLAALNAYEKKNEASVKRMELAADLAVLEKRATELEKEIEVLEDPRGVEYELRSRYELSKEGEEVIVFVEEEEEEEVVEETVEEEKGFWKSILGIFF